jgi:hypothetical protein
MLQQKNKNYERGANFERRVAAYFEAQGFYATRSAGSHKKFDVIAFNGLTVYAVQCKWGGTAAQAEKLVNTLALGVQADFEEIAYPLVIVVAYDLKKGVLIGPARMLMPEDQRSVKNGPDKEEKTERAVVKDSDA